VHENGYTSSTLTLKWKPEKLTKLLCDRC
jgi:hypothetical protein